MNINEAQSLGVIYTFIVLLGYLILPCLFVGGITITDSIYETKEIVVDGKTELVYDFNSATAKDWVFAKKAGRFYFEILVFVTFIISVIGGRRFGREVLIHKKADLSSPNIVLYFQLSFTISSFWYFIYLLILNRTVPSAEDFFICVFIVGFITLAVGILSNHMDFDNIESSLVRLLNRHVLWIR